jgi:hypothetical protein
MPLKAGCDPQAASWTMLFYVMNYYDYKNN